MRSIDPAVAAARAWHEADDVAMEGDPAVVDMDRALAVAKQADRAFAASVPTTAAGAIAKLRVCMKVIATAQTGDEITESGIEYLAVQIEATIKGLSLPRLVWHAQNPAS